MKNSTRVLLLAVFCFVFGSLAYADTYSFVSNSENLIFDGSNGFHFGAVGVADSHIVAAAAGLGSLVGLQQDIGGNFTIGAIDSSVPNLQTAPVTGSGTYTIWATPLDFLTGTIKWIDISTYGTSGNLNVSGILNVDYDSYSGANAGLQYLASKAGSIVVTFQFVPAKNLTYLAGNAASTAFSGSATVPDGGTTLVLLGSALMGLTTLRRKFRA
ncbi:VPDSG-CTERM sorting domain-containing protein [Paludibaculum fermentans]|uniref:VPDSG-CTERM sorting domain-containing protein n=1 Tax=Paludibaculum fermentans TaxID=1473598 RepID=UPI003EBCA6DB